MIAKLHYDCCVTCQLVATMVKYLSVHYFVISIKGNLQSRVISTYKVISTCKVITCECKYFALKLGLDGTKDLAKVAIAL